MSWHQGREDFRGSLWPNQGDSHAKSWGKDPLVSMDQRLPMKRLLGHCALLSPQKVSGESV